MSKRHDAVFDDVLSGLPAGKKAEDRASARFLKRSNTMAEQASGERQEKVLRLVDPADCRMWERHNRAYELLTPEKLRGSDRWDQIAGAAGISGNCAPFAGRAGRHL